MIACRLKRIDKVKYKNKLIMTVSMALKKKLLLFVNFC